MGRRYQYFPPPPPPPACKELDWNYLPRGKKYLVTMLEPIEINDWVVHCINGDTGLIVVECPWELLRQLKTVLSQKIDQTHRQVHIVKNLIRSENPKDFSIFLADGSEL